MQRVKTLDDPRVIIRKSKPSLGFMQHALSTMAARELFSVYACDWVLPIDADEYWHSRRFGSVRTALEHLAGDIHGLMTCEYRFYESARDNPDEPLFLKRLLHARATGQRKAVLYKLGSCGFRWLLAIIIFALRITVSRSGSVLLNTTSWIHMPCSVCV